MQLTVDEILSADHLQMVWNAIKESYHEQLVRDPLDLLAFEADLESNLKQLAFQARRNHYRPGPPDIIRAAKRNGLTRGLAFLEITDTLVLKAIVDALQSDLHHGFPDCVSFGRSQEKAFRASARDYETWFQAWMRHQRTVEHLLDAEGCKWVVKADVSNFFPSISHVSPATLFPHPSAKEFTHPWRAGLIYLTLARSPWQVTAHDRVSAGGGSYDRRAVDGASG